MNVSDVYAKIRNIFNLGAFKSRNDKTVTVQTEFGRTIEAEELFPYGFFAKGMEGKAVVLSQGGNPAASGLQHENAIIEKISFYVIVLAKKEGVQAFLLCSKIIQCPSFS